jgi:ribosomal protein L37AE/L43A
MYKTMKTGLHLINEITDVAFLKKLSKLIDDRLAKEVKKSGNRKCMHCGDKARPRFLLGSNSCNRCYENGAGAGGFNY